MELLLVFAIVTLLARLAGHFGARAFRDWAAAGCVGLAAMFLCTAAAHFISLRADLVRMVPPWIPNPELMVTFTGVCEFLGAVGLLVPRTRRIAALALILMLIALLPANIHAARMGLTLGGKPVEPVIPRIALQLAFTAMIWWCALRKARRQ